MWTENQYDEFENKMHSEYPKMFSEGYGGFCIGPGWWHIVDSLCCLIQHHLDWVNKDEVKVAQVVVHQVKEKFGGFRFYYSGGDDYTDGLVRMAERWSENTCEDCGVPGKERNGSWIRTLCDKHAEERGYK